MWNSAHLRRIRGQRAMASAASRGLPNTSPSKANTDSQPRTALHRWRRRCKQQHNKQAKSTSLMGAIPQPPAQTKGSIVRPRLQWSGRRVVGLSRDLIHHSGIGQALKWHARPCTVYHLASRYMTNSNTLFEVALSSAAKTIG